MNTFLEELDSFCGLIIAARIFHFEKYISLGLSSREWFHSKGFNVKEVYANFILSTSRAIC